MSARAHEARLSRYLRPGAAQHRLLGEMARGHGRLEHREELGAPSPGRYQKRVKRHLGRAPVAHAVTDGDLPTRYFVADPKRNQVAWINPDATERSTFFEPKQGVRAYVAHRRTSNPAERWVALDIAVARGASQQATRAAAHSMTSAQRSPRGPGRGRER